jgi:hypothetical protein
VDYFDCFICGINMLRDYLIIKCHVRSRHKMGMVEYARDHAKRTKSEEKGPKGNEKR